MSDLLEIFNHLPPLTISTAVAGIFITGSLLILLRDWAQALLALAIQYLLFAWLLQRCSEVWPQISPVPQDWQSISPNWPRMSGSDYRYLQHPW